MLNVSNEPRSGATPPPRSVSSVERRASASALEADFRPFDSCLRRISEYSTRRGLSLQRPCQPVFAPYTT